MSMISFTTLQARAQPKGTRVRTHDIYRFVVRGKPSGLITGLVALAALGVPGIAQAQVDDAPRRTPFHISSARSLVDLQTCITRHWSTVGFITPLPLDHGVALDFNQGINEIGRRGKSPLTFEITDDQTVRDITIAYRHPLSMKFALVSIKETGMKCFPAETAAQIGKLVMPPKAAKTTR